MDILEMTARAAEVYGIHCGALFRALRRDRLTSAEKSAGMKNDSTFFSLTKDGIDLSKVDWSVIDMRDELDVPEIAPERLVPKDRRGTSADARALVVALMNVFDDIKPFAHFSIRAGEFPRDLGCGFDIAPLISISDRGRKIALDILTERTSGDMLRDPYERLSIEFQRWTSDVFSASGDAKPLLSRASAAAAKHWTGSTLVELLSAPTRTIVKRANIIGFIQAAKRMLVLLYRRLRAVENSERRARMTRALEEGMKLYLRMCLVELLDAGYGAGAMRMSPADALDLLCDEAEGTIKGRMNDIIREIQDTSALALLPTWSYLLDQVVSRDHVIVRFRFDRKKFLTLGDAYGDCTSSAPSNQVDTSVTNIHWTVYPWALSPCYRVIEVCTAAGRPLVKAHVVPLVIDGKNVLMADAIEAVPALRVESGASYSARLFDEYAHEAFDALMSKCVEIAKACDAHAAYADMYSNAVWVRDLLESRYEHDSYCTANVEVPFSSFEVEDNISLIKKDLGLSEETPKLKMEIQAINMGLMHQGALSNYKICAVLWGLRGDWSVKVRGL